MTDERRERNITTDRETIRNWADERNAVPVWRSSDDDQGRGQYEFRHRDEVDETRHERHDWDEFHNRFEEQNHAFVYGEHPEGGLGEHEFVNRDEAAARATLENEEIEERLLEGETVQTEVQETRIVEREIVETDTIESEVIDSVVVAEDTIDREFVRRDVVETDIDITSDIAELRDARVELEVEEMWIETDEIVERKTVESRVVDTDVEEHDTVESDTVSARVDVEGVQRTLLESDVVGIESGHDEVIESGNIRSERVETNEGEVIQSEIYERQIVEEKIVERKRLLFDLTDTETTGTETVSRSVVETELVDEEYEGVVREERVETERGGTAEVGTVETADDRREGTETTASATGTDTATDTNAGAGTNTSAGAGTGADTGMGSGTDTGTGTGTEAGRGGAFDLSTRDEGKDVVDDTGREIGMVTDIDEDAGTIYVDPNPSLTDKIKANLHWGDHDDDAYSLSHDQIKRLDNDKVVIHEPGTDATDTTDATDDRL